MAPKAPKAPIGNPLWLEWVENWAHQAEETGIKSVQAYKKAASSLRKCPVTYVHPEQTITLVGIGPGIVKRLEASLKAHCESTGQQMPQRIVPAKKAPATKAKAPGAASNKKRSAQSDEETEEDRAREERRQRTKTGFVPVRAPARAPTPLDLSDNDDAPAAAGPARAKSSKVYVPRRGSGAYAILIALYVLSSYDERDKWCTRDDIIPIAAQHSDTPFDKATANRRGRAEGGAAYTYSAWNGNKTLRDHELVVSENRRPIRYGLTEAGYKLAESIAAKAGVAKHVRGPSSSSAGAFGGGGGSSSAARRPAGPIAGRFNDDEDDEDDGDLAAQAEEDEQLAQAIAESLKPTHASTGRSASYGDYGATSLAPAERMPLPKPKPRDPHPSSLSPRAAPVLDGRKASKGPYAAQVVEPAQAPTTQDEDSPFGYHYLDEDNVRVKRRDQAEVGQDDNYDSTYRIEYRVKQDLHQMARSIFGKSKLTRTTPLPGPATKSGYLRGRVANLLCPGFLEGPAKAAATPADDAMACLMGGYKAPAKVHKAAYLAAPADICRSGNDAYAAGRLSLPAAGGSTSGTASTSKLVTKPPVARTHSAPVRANAGTSSANGSRAIPGPWDASLRPSSSQPIAVSFDRLPNQPLINRHPLDPVRDYVSTEAHHFPRFDSIVWPAGSFKVVLIIDTREIGTDHTNRTEMVDKVAETGVLVDRKMLPLGDMIWVARRYRNEKATTGEDDVVLDAIVERKRLDDLCGSIRDGRYNTQKVRIKESAISHRIYLIEKYDAAAQYTKWGAQIWTAKSQLQVNDGFYVHESANIADTVNYLSQRTKVMMEMYEQTDLHVIPDKHIDRPSYLAFQQHLRSTRPATKFLTTYSSFASLNKTDAALTLRKQWGSMVQRVNGVSAEKALQVIRRWPTPLSFFSDAEAHRLEVEEENARLDDLQSGKGKSKKRKAEDFVTEVLGGDAPQRGVKGKLGTRLFHLFAAEQYVD